jgi:hypothetical protein
VTKGLSPLLIWLPSLIVIDALHDQANAGRIPCSGCEASSLELDGGRIVPLHLIRRHRHNGAERAGACLLVAPKAELVLSEEETVQLSRLAGSRALPQSAEGASNCEIANCLQWINATVGKCPRRFMDRHVLGLYDELRPGRPRSIEDEQVAALLKSILRGNQRPERTGPHARQHRPAESPNPKCIGSFKLCGSTSSLTHFQRLQRSVLR